MAGHQCWFLSLTRGYCLDPRFRQQAWHKLSTRLQQDWPEMQAWTVIEFSPKRGVHLHVVLKGVPGISREWVDHVVGLQQDGTAAHLECVHDAEGLVLYLTKGLADSNAASGWPRYFRPVTATRGWCPDWRTRKGAA
jgi:hypothetical protein